MLEVLTNFWQHVYDSLTVSAQEKVLNVRHDFQKSHWQAIARVLVYGYVRKNYFPIHLSQAFVAATLFGEESISSEFMFHSFQLYVSCEEKDTLLAALAGNLPLDDEDLWDVLSNYKCYRCITMDNITQTVNELAQKDFFSKSTIIFSRSTTCSSCMR